MFFVLGIGMPHTAVTLEALIMEGPECYIFLKCTFYQHWQVHRTAFNPSRRSILDIAQ